MAIRIALAGNPNSGKTTMFNELTGSSQYVGNWPGVTVEKKEGKLKGHKDVIIMDLPGIYSLSPYTLEEVVARNYLIEDKPDVIINIVDASNLERNLYLTTQLTELGIPVIIALNMFDVVQKNGDFIDIDTMSAQLGCQLSKTSALKSVGCKELAEKAVGLARTHAKTEPKHVFSDNVEKVLSNITQISKKLVAEDQVRWMSIKLFEKDQKVLEKYELAAEDVSKLNEIIEQCESKMDDDSESIITNERYNYITSLLKKCYRRNKHTKLTTSDKIDKVVTNRWLALPIFAIIMFSVYYLAITTIGTMGTDWVNDVLFGKIIPPATEHLLQSLHTAPWLDSLILNGIIGGIGAVLGFLPQMMVLFFLLAILEDSGYMSRIAFIMDRIFRRFGLSGKSFIPMLVATGCGVPGVMSSRTIESERDRKMTIMTTTFIPCSAKLPIIALIAGALFPNSWWVGPSAYFAGIGAIIVSGIILKKSKLFAGDPAPFVMELPSYRVPGLKGLLIHMWDRGMAFAKKAGTIIFTAACVIWFLSSFNWKFEMVDTSYSILASMGKFIAVIFAPLGWDNWKAAVAAITGLIAKENVVGTFGVLYGHNNVGDNGSQIWSNLQASYTQLSAYTFLLFNLFCAPCFAAIGAISREMGTAKWTWIAIGYQTLFAYIVGFCVYQLGMLFTGHGFSFAGGLAILIVMTVIYQLFKPYKAGVIR